MATIELLTDEDILDYTKSDGVDRVILNHYDFNLKKKKQGFPEAVQGGLYDMEIFGSPIFDRCYCGKIQQPTNEPCPNCGCRVYKREEALRRFARIELPFYYLSELRFELFLSTFKDIFSESTIELDFAVKDNLKAGGYSSSKGTKNLGMKVFDSCQFEYDSIQKKLTISEFITDESKASYEGLLEIIKEHFPSRLNDYKKLINKYYLILPAVMRPYSLRRDPETKSAKLGLHRMQQWYKIVVCFCCTTDIDANPVNYTKVIESMKTPGERVKYTALMRSLLNLGKKNATELLNSSKKNLARELYSIRTKNSARCPIVPSTDIAIDEFGVPTHIAYEMCREGFSKYLKDELNFTDREAKDAIEKEAFNEKTQELFKEYAEKQVVLEIILTGTLRGLETSYNN